jgi:hypothetical protein
MHKRPWKGSNLFRLSTKTYLQQSSAFDCDNQAMVRIAPAFASLLVFATVAVCAPATVASSSAISQAASTIVQTTSTSSFAVSPTNFPPEWSTVSPASDSPNTILWTPDSSSGSYQPIRGQLGGTILGPQNEQLQKENADLLAPPTTDEGTM